MKKIILLLLLCCAITGCIKDNKDDVEENNNQNNSAIIDEYKFDSEVSYDFKDIPSEEATYEELSEINIGRGIDYYGYAIDYTQGKITGSKKSIKKYYTLCNEYIVNSGELNQNINQYTVKNNIANNKEAEAKKELEGVTKNVSIIGVNISLVYLDEQYEMNYQGLGERAKKELEDYGYDCFRMIYGEYYNSKSITGVWKSIGVKLKTTDTGCFVTAESKQELVKVLKKEFLYGYNSLNSKEKKIYDKLTSGNISYLSLYENGNYLENYGYKNDLKKYIEDFKANAGNKNIKGLVQSEYTMYPEIKTILEK